MQKIPASLAELTPLKLSSIATVVAGSQIAHQLLEWECLHSDIKTSLETMWRVYAPKD